MDKAYLTTDAVIRGIKYPQGTPFTLDGPVLGTNLAYTLRMHLPTGIETLHTSLDNINYVLSSDEEWELLIPHR